MRFKERIEQLKREEQLRGELSKSTEPHLAPKNVASRARDCPHRRWPNAHLLCIGI